MRVGPHDGISALLVDAPESSVLRGHGEKGDLTRYQACQHGDPGPPSLQNCEKYICCL